MEVFLRVWPGSLVPWGATLPLPRTVHTVGLARDPRGLFAMRL